MDPNFPFEVGIDLEGFDTLISIYKPFQPLHHPSNPEYFYLTAKASNNINLINAINKFKLCTEMYFIDSMSLHEEVDWKTTEYTYIQIKFAYAIIFAYSIVEELCLEIRASKEKPSHKPNGDWNTETLQNLLNRLKKANINVNKPIVWMARGEPTENEIKRRVKIEKRAEWADSPEYKDDISFFIDDGYPYLPDAICYISYLRSEIASHRVGEKIYGLSVFDVANAQHLARRLILESVGMWG